MPGFSSSSRSASNASADALVRPPPMTPEARQLVATMRQHVEGMPYPAALKAWADEACCHRYLRARQHNLDKALAMLENSLKWREEFGPSRTVTEFKDEVRQLGSFGCNYVHGKDKLGRPVIYMKPRFGDKNVGTQRQQMRHLVYTLERAIAEMEDDVEKYVVIIDYTGYSMRNAPNFSTQKETVSIFQDQYPERLGLAVMVDAPTLFHQTFKLLRPFVDPVTSNKIMFVSGKDKAYFQGHFDLAQLESDFTGTDPYKYDPESYFADVPVIRG